MRSLIHTFNLLALAASLALFPAARAEAENTSALPARVFGSDMVLQCNAPIRIWGTADKGEAVTVTLGEEVSKTTADAEGNWIASFAPRKLLTFATTRG